MHSHQSHDRRTKIIISITCITIFVVIIIGIITLTPPPCYADVFANLNEVESYAQSTNELTPMEGINTLKPSFSNYYATLAPTTSHLIKEKLRWLLYCVGLTKRPSWSITGFKSVLDRISQQNERKGFKNNIIAKITGTKTDRYIVFGALQGAFHSLLRDLQHLEKLGIINQSLKIIHPCDYIIFMGEVVDRSAFTLETLSLVMKILEANPDNALYLRGGHETKNYWQEHTLKTELLVRARHISSAKIPLEKEVNRFFNTLPLAFYIGMYPTPTKDFIRISKRGIGSSPLLDEKNYAPFLSAPHDKLTPATVTEDAELTDVPITIRAILKSEKKRYAYQSMEGLRILPNDTGVTAWTLLSCPTVVYEKAKGMSFFFDAFTIITPGEKLSDWNITLYRRDRRTNDPFLPKTFNLLSGLENGVAKPNPALTEEESQEKDVPNITPIPKPNSTIKNTPTPVESLGSVDFLLTPRPGSHSRVLRQAQDERAGNPAERETKDQDESPNYAKATTGTLDPVFQRDDKNDDITITSQPGQQTIPLINLTVGDKPTTVTITVTTQPNDTNTNPAKGK